MATKDVEMQKGGTVFRHACELGVEGIVSKRRDAPYRSGRHETWIKLKCTNSDIFPIVAFVEKAGRRRFCNGGLLTPRAVPQRENYQQPDRRMTQRSRTAPLATPARNLERS